MHVQIVLPDTPSAALQHRDPPPYVNDTQKRINAVSWGCLLRVVRFVKSVSRATYLGNVS
jgi:hypothetical protein